MRSEVLMEQIRKRLSEKLGENYEVEKRTVLKNNGVEAEGFSVRKAGDVLAAVLYPGPLDESTQEEPDQEESGQDKNTLEDSEGYVDVCVEELLKTYRRREEQNDGLREMVRRMEDWEAIRPYIRPQLLSCIENQRLVPKLVHRRFLDLAVVYAARMECGLEQGTIRIERPVFEQWGISEEELYRQALKNLEQDGYTIQSLPEALGMAFLPGADEGAPSMAVFTNRSRFYGAAGLLLPGMLEEYAKKMGSSLFLIPSSVHELLLIPDDGRLPAKALDQMVKDVNREEVLPMDQLSGHVYYYDRESRQVGWRNDEEWELKGMMRNEGLLGAV